MDLDRWKPTEQDLEDAVGVVITCYGCGTRYELDYVDLLTIHTGGQVPCECGAMIDVSAELSVLQFA